MSGAYESGKEEGVWKWWHENGQLAYESSYKSGKLDGPWKSWYSNGQLKMEGTYESGKKIGDWKEWNENGELQKERQTSSWRLSPRPLFRGAISLKKLLTCNK